MFGYPATEMPRWASAPLRQLLQLGPAGPEYAHRDDELVGLKARAPDDRVDRSLGAVTRYDTGPSHSIDSV
jgi:hypothetical protein